MDSNIGCRHNDPRYLAPILDTIGEQAAQADRTRSVEPETIAAIKNNDVMRMSASPELAGLDESICAIADELRACAAVCTSTAWCLWNHLCTFHFFCGLLGPENQAFLADITREQQWVCFPAGASSSVAARADGHAVVLDGVAAFGSGARYAEWAGVIFNQGTAENPAMKFTMADLREKSVRIEATWEAMAVRASATDHIYYEGARVPDTRIVTFPEVSRVMLRDPQLTLINNRYREDWVALSVMWLGAMACGVAGSSLSETCDNIQERIAIFGTKMKERPTIHLNLGRARALINAATRHRVCRLRGNRRPDRCRCDTVRNRLLPAKFGRYASGLIVRRGDAPDFAGPRWQRLARKYCFRAPLPGFSGHAAAHQRPPGPHHRTHRARSAGPRNEYADLVSACVSYN